ncbi:MAG: hypothetical protein IPF66_15645 [Holophagales bacterium]|nr:hypothetical protein [Holophagales bacterium]
MFFAGRPVGDVSRSAISRCWRRVIRGGGGEDRHGIHQDERKFSLTTPLGKDVLLFRGLTGEEGLSKLFEFEVLALAENRTKVPFDGLLGQKVTVKMKMGVDETPCFLNGLCHRVRQAGATTRSTYRIGMVPEIWKLGKKARSRIFQQKTVPEILKKVLEGFEVSWELTATYEPRDFCVQYRERPELRLPPHGGGGDLVSASRTRTAAARWSSETPRRFTRTCRARRH